MLDLCRLGDGAGWRRHEGQFGIVVNNLIALAARLFPRQSILRRSEMDFDRPHRDT